jgi:rSAM/selenodomain-associated transferase 1
MPLIGPEVKFAVFAKAPVAGEVKTRLAPVLGDEGAAELHRRLVLHTLDTVREVSDNAVLYCAPDTDHPFFVRCAKHYGIELEHQCRGDLGVRMLHACIDHLKAGTAFVIVGTDCPVLDADRLVQAVVALAQGAHIALAPAEDGGYAAIALRRCAPELFSDMPWGTDGVMAETRLRLRRLGWRWTELESVWDVDRPADYERLCREGWMDVLPQ